LDGTTVGAAGVGSRNVPPAPRHTKPSPFLNVLAPPGNFTVVEPAVVVQVVVGVANGGVARTP
jgi:hypothetical protein